MTISRFCATFGLALIATSPVLAAGDDDDVQPEPTETSTKCEEGQVWDPKTETCLEATDQSFNDTDRYKAARELAYAGKIREATIVLASADNPNDPRILNYKGFTQRKLGNMATAMVFYEQALTIDPDYNLARSYMGQGLVSMGRDAQARDQLVEIAMRGGIGTWPYEALKQALAGRPTNY